MIRKNLTKKAPTGIGYCDWLAHFLGLGGVVGKGRDGLGFDVLILGITFSFGIGVLL